MSVTEKLILGWQFINGLFLAWIALQQRQLSRRQFEYTRYERRVLLFRAVTEFISKVNQEFKFDGRTVVPKLYGDTAESPFLFGVDGEIYKYIEELGNNAKRLSDLSEALDEPGDRLDLGEGAYTDRPLTKSEEKEIGDEMLAIHGWFKEQQTIVVEKFRKRLTV